VSPALADAGNVSIPEHPDKKNVIEQQIMKRAGRWMHGFFCIGTCLHRGKEYVNCTGKMK